MSQRRSPIEHNRLEQAKRDRWRRKKQISDSVERCSRALERAGDINGSGGQRWYDIIEDEIRDVLFPLLREESAQRLLWYDGAGDRFNHDCLDRFVSTTPQGFRATGKRSRRLLVDVFHSLAAVAEAEGCIEDELENTAAVRGHALPLGKMHVKWEDTVREPIHVVDPDGSPPVSVTQGTRGFGKSTSIASEVEDRYAAGRKIIDMADLSKLENGVYDAPQNQEDLRDAREDLKLPEDFTECEGYERPEMQIMVPVTPGLEDETVPFKEGSDESPVTLFSVPASEIPRPVFNNMITHSTDVQQTFLDRAYQTISEEQDDWSLLDLAEAVLETDAQEGVKTRIWNTLAELQNVGFIRTKDCPHAIDWEDIFQDQETITAFTMSKLDDDAHKYMVMAYLVNRIWRWRDEYDGDLPEATAVFRELHNLAPTDNVASEDEREREVQSALVSEFQSLCAEGRHHQLEVLADTQQFQGQIHKRVREHAERIVTFRSPVGVLKPLFKHMIGLDGDRFNYMTTIARDFEPGQAAVIGYTGTDRSLEMPIDWAPPMSHHVDADKGESGWEMRVELLDEETRPVPWDCSLPGTLTFDEIDANQDEEKNKFEVFADRYLKEERDGELDTDIAIDVFHEAMNELGFSGDVDKAALSRHLGKVLDFESEQRGAYPDETTYWLGLAYTPEGHRLRQRAQEPVQ